MKFALIKCTNPNCSHEWTITANDDQAFAQCDDCLQMNTIPETARKVMDLCSYCGKAYEDHDFSTGEPICRKVKK